MNGWIVRAVDPRLLTIAVSIDRTSVRPITIVAVRPTEEVPVTIDAVRTIAEGLDAETRDAVAVDPGVGAFPTKNVETTAILVHGAGPFPPTVTHPPPPPRRRHPP